MSDELNNDQNKNTGADDNSTQVQEVSLTDIHTMSDDEMLDFELSDDAIVAGTNDDSDDDDGSQGGDNDSAQAHDDDNDDDELTDEQKAQLAAMQDSDADDADDDDDSNDSNDSDDGEPSTDYKAFHEALTKPFKANGREITITDPEEAIALMQKGLGYNKDMQALAPYKKVTSLLKKRNALDPVKLDFILDVAEGKPEALAKFLKDNNINPMDVNVDDGDNYQSEYEDTSGVDTLNEVLNSLEPGENKIKTLEIFADGGWDDASKKELYANPNNIRVLNKQVSNGTYDIIMAEVDKQRALGNYLDVSDLEAYNAVGTILANKAGPDISGKSNNSSSTKNSNDSQQKRNQQRKKASDAPRRASSNAPASTGTNMAMLSDEEVEKAFEETVQKELDAQRQAAS